MEHYYPPALFPTQRIGDYFNTERLRSWSQATAVPVSRTPPSSSPSFPTRSVMEMSSESKNSSVVHLSSAQVSAIATLLATSNGDPDPGVAIASHEGKKRGGIGGLVDSVSRMFASPSSVTLQSLVKRGITLKQLVMESPVGAAIPISDLKKAGLVRSFHDMLDLGFKTSDLTVSPRYFSCSNCVMLYGIDYTLLKDTPQCGGFSIMTLIEARPPFTCMDLQTLNVTAEALIKDSAYDDGTPMDPRFIAAVGLSMRDWLELGLTSDLLVYLGVPHTLAARSMKWVPEHVDRTFGMPQGWLST